MNDAPHPALLPTGMHDLLPPEAELEASIVSQLMATLAAHGYQRVKPPLVEFEETLFSGAGATMATATFRTMDPVSHRMIGVRADMTPQIARIAATRLGNAPRPLRSVLCRPGAAGQGLGDPARASDRPGRCRADRRGGPGGRCRGDRRRRRGVDGDRCAPSLGRHHAADPGAGGRRGLRHRRARGPRRCAPRSTTRTPRRSARSPATRGRCWAGCSPRRVRQRPRCRARPARPARAGERRARAARRRARRARHRRP